MTKLKYLEDSYLYKYESVFIEEKNHEKWTALILEETIFYPQWGWQKSDIWKIFSEDSCFLVNNAKLDENWIVWHFWEFLNWNFKKWEKVKLEIDEEKRIENSKLHSAWHLIDCGIQKIWVKNFEPIKWFHFIEWPYVEYKWTIENIEEFTEKLQTIIDELVSSNIQVEKREISLEEAKNRWIFAPEWKSARIVNFAWFQEVWCWWTHINYTKELWKITIRKIKSKWWNTKISYNIR